MKQLEFFLYLMFLTYELTYDVQNTHINQIFLQRTCKLK